MDTKTLLNTAMQMTGNDTDRLNVERAANDIVRDSVIRHVTLHDLAQTYEAYENRRLDFWAERCGLHKECHCLDDIHTDHHQIHMQRTWIAQNARILRRGGQLVVTAFAREESRRLQDLLYFLEGQNRKTRRTR